MFGPKRFPSAVLAAVLILLAGAPSYAQTTIPYSGGTYNQDFDGLPNTGTFTYVGPGPFDFSASPTSIATCSRGGRESKRA